MLYICVYCFLRTVSRLFLPDTVAKASACAARRAAVRWLLQMRSMLFVFWKYVLIPETWSHSGNMFAIYIYISQKYTKRTKHK